MLRASALRLWPGTALTLGASGIVSMVEKWPPTALLLFSIANNAVRSLASGILTPLRRTSARITVNLVRAAHQAWTILRESALFAGEHSGSTDTKATSAVPVSVVQSRAAGKARVYNLHVSEQHEYFAEGVLVHNCYDAIRYGLTNAPSKKPKPARQQQSPYAGVSNL